MPVSTSSAPLARVRFLIVNGFTSLNLLIGVVALIAASAGATTLAAYGLLLCVLLDGCDGSLARRWKVTSEFGAQLDSLADMTSFIVAGATLVFYWAQGAAPQPLIMGASSLYVLSGAVRLARFNVGVPSTTFFEGMPTTIVAALLAANYLAAGGVVNSYLVIGLVTLLALLMVSLLPYPKLATMQRYCPAWAWVALALCAVASPTWTVWVVTLAYIALGPAIWLYQKVRR